MGEPSFRDKLLFPDSSLKVKSIKKLKDDENATNIEEVHHHDEDRNASVASDVLSNYSSTEVTTRPKFTHYLDEQRLAELRSKEIEKIVQVYSEVFTTENKNSVYCNIDNDRQKSDRSLVSSATVAPTILSVPTTKPTSTTILVVSGPTGSGKTTLVQSALQDRTKQHGGYYIRGTFNVRQHPDPYRAVTIAFTDYTYQVLERGPESIRKVRSAILKACGDEITALTQIIPVLTEIIEHKDSDSTPSIQGATDLHDDTDINLTDETAFKSSGVQQFVFAFQNFIRAISSKQEPVVLLLDDIQYADDSSVDLLGSIIKDLPSIPGLFVICTCNGSELRQSFDYVKTTMKNSSFVNHLLEIERTSNGKIKVEEIPINYLELEQVRTVVEKKAKLFSNISDSDFYTFVLSETNGNLYLIDEFLRWLVHRLQTSMNGPSPWTVQDIHREVLSQQKLEKEVQYTDAYYLSSKLETLPVEAIEVLKVAACLGSSYIENSLIEHVLDLPVESLTSYAMDIGILTTMHDKGNLLTFIHEIAETFIYNRLLKQNPEEVHLEIGRRLWRALDVNNFDRYIFVVLSQMHLGRRFIKLPSDRYEIAELCLHAGRKAAKLSAFSISLFYLKFGTELLGVNGWSDAYDLTLAMNNAVAEMEVNQSNYERVETIVSLVVQNSRSKDDTIQVRTTQLYAYGMTDRQQDAVNLAMDILVDLNCLFPRHLNIWTLRNELVCVLSLLKGKSDEYLKRMPFLEDGKILTTIQILSMMSLNTILVRPNLFPYIVLKMMKVTLSHGLSFISPTAFAAFAMICIRVFKKPDIAIRYGELSLDLLDMLKVREYVPIVYVAYYSCVFIWKYPVCDTLEYFIHGHRVGMQTGHVEVACFCSSLWIYTASECDIPLEEIEVKGLEFLSNMKSYRQQSISNLSAPVVQAVQYLLGRDVNFTETDRLLEYCIDKNITQAKNLICGWRAKLFLLFNDPHKAYEFSNLIDIFSKSRPTSVELVQVPFIHGMISFRLARQSPHSLRKRRRYMREAKSMLQFIKKYAMVAPTNFIDKELLLKAELAAVEGKPDKAMANYRAAIEAAKVSHDIFVQGMANERAGQYCVSNLEQTDTARQYFEAALIVYDEWKAHRKVNHLREEMNKIFCND